MHIRRIALVIPSLHAGGAEFVARQWIKGTEELIEWKVYTFLPTRTGFTAYSNASISQFPGGIGGLRKLLYVRWLARRIRQDRPDIVLSMLTICNIASILAVSIRRKRAPRPSILISERNIPTRYLPLEGVGGDLQRYVAKILYRHADAAIAIGHVVAADLLSYGLTSERIRVVNNPVLAEAPDALPVRALRSSNKIRLLFVGRLVEQKRPLLFVQTIAELQSRGYTASGTIVGSGELDAEIRKAVDNLHVRCEMAGWLEDWTSVADSSDVLVLPSSVEGFGNVLIESAAVGLPGVATSDALAVADAIAVGVTGELASHPTATSLADSIERALGIEIGSAAMSFLKRFTVQSSLEMLLSVLDEFQPSGEKCLPKAEVTPHD